MRRIYDDSAYAPSPVGSYWEAITPPGPLDQPLDGDTHADVAIIGAGYTGLSAALHLARDFGCAPLVLDAQEVGWGASGRNGGFNCLGGAKLSDGGWVRRYGADDLGRYYRAKRAATELVGDLTADRDIGRQVGGEWALAHRQSDFDGFADWAETLNRLAGIGAEIVPQGALGDRGLAMAGAFGAMRVDAGFPLNPRAYVQALAAAVRDAGGRICAKTPVDRIAPDGGGVAIHTARGIVRADRVILAGNGYNSDDVPGWMAGRYMPVISHIMVTEPLTGGGWHGCQMAYDTRKMLHYFRRLPDGRMLFGQRGAAQDGPEARARMRADVQRDFATMFPDWAGAKVDHHWAGFVCTTAKLTPYVGPLGDLPGAWTALAYHGNGVSMGTWCGQRVAGLAMGRDYGELPDGFRAVPGRVPFGAARRRLLPLVFRWYGMQDR